MARAIQKGEVPASRSRGPARRIAKTVKVESVRDFARKSTGTNRKALAAQGAAQRLRRRKHR